MSTLSITTKPGKKYRSLRRPRVYEVLRRQGYSKQAAARISNAQARKKSYTLDQLEAFVSSTAYDPQTASLIALGIPELPRFKGEQIAPGITRIRGNLCNVHGKYGPCDKALSGKKKPAKGRKPVAPKKTDAQRAAERDQKRQQNVADVAKRMADTDTGLSPAGVRELTAFAAGKQPEGAHGEGLAKMGLAERASDGTYRMTPTGRAVVSAMQAGDYQRAVDAISRGTDAQGKRTERQTAAQTRQEAARARQAEVATRRQAAEAKRLQREQERAQKKPAKAGGGGSKKPEQQAAEKPLKVRPTKRLARSSAPSVGGVGGGSSAAKKPSPPAPAPEKEREPAKQIAPALQEAATALSQGKQMTDEQINDLVRNGLAKIDKNSGMLVLTAAGMRATTKAQTAQERAMFAKMGGGGSGGGGGGAGGGKGGGSKLWPKGPNGKRTPQAAAAQSRGGGGDNGKGDSGGSSVAALKKKHDSEIAAIHKRHDDQVAAAQKKFDDAGDRIKKANTPDEKRAAVQSRAAAGRDLTNAKEDAKAKRDHDLDEAQSRHQREQIQAENRETDRAIAKRDEENRRHAADAADERKQAHDAREARAEERRREAERDWRFHVSARSDSELEEMAARSGSELAGNLPRYAREELERRRNKKTTKETSFAVFKDATGRWRWVAQSSTAFQDRDKEIVSTKALADDCAFADAHGNYGPLRWWHTPGLDLGECDFNAMHGRVLIESGTFKSEDIARKVAKNAPQLEISLGFLHLPSEPDAHGVFHHIRKFERSLVPRGKASNRFTAFTVKEIPMLDATKVAALKTLGFSDDDITNLQSQAQATEKAADAEKVAYKAEEPRTPGLHQGSASGEFAETGGIAELPDLVINGVTYKALPPSPPTAEDVIEEDAIGEMPMEEEATGGLTLSPEDLQAITEVFQTGLAQVMGALDLEKKVAGHVQGLLAPYTAQKDASDAEKAEQIQALQASLKAAQEQQEATQAKLDELLGLQPAVKTERATESTTTTINPWVPQDAQLLESIKGQVSHDQQHPFGDLMENLFGNRTPGQA